MSHVIPALGAAIIALMALSVYKIVQINMSLIETRVSSVLPDDRPKSAAMSERLLKVAALGDLYLVKDVISKGADLNYADEYGWTPLIQAAAMKRADVVKYLVMNGADLNARTHDGLHALQHAVMADDVSLVRFLLSRGADPALAGKYGWNARETAHKRSREKVLNFFRRELTH